MWRTASFIVLTLGLLGGAILLVQHNSSGIVSAQRQDGDSGAIDRADTIAAEQVELFDTDKERVVKTYENTTLFQQEAQTLLKTVSGRVLDLQPSLSHALIVKIPLAPPQKLVHRQAQIDTMIASMFVIMPKEGSRRPWMILHTKEEETLLVEFAVDVEQLRKLARLP